MANVHDSRHGADQDSHPQRVGPDGARIEPCENCGTPIVCTTVDFFGTPLTRWSEYHGEVTPGEHWYFAHPIEVCQRRRHAGPAVH